MGSLFVEHVFPKYVNTDVMKSHMNGLADPSLRCFSLLNLSAAMKIECKEEGFESEFVESFLNAARELASAGRMAIDKPGMYIAYKHSYALPVMFLTRHCMELAIKRATKKLGYEPKKVHGLQGLWDSLVSRFPARREREDRRALSNMGEFVKAIADIDSNGMSLRYPQDRLGKLTQDRVLFVNNEELVAYLEKFVRQLESIDFNSLSKDVK